MTYRQKIASIEYQPLTSRPIQNIKLVCDDTIAYRYKHSNREALDRLFAKRGACSEVLIVKKGYVCDTSIANIAFWDEKRWITPKRVLLNGTTRQRLLDNNLLIEKDIHDIHGYKKLALMNAVIGFKVFECSVIEDEILLKEQKA